MAAKFAGFVSSNDELSPDGTLALADWIMVFSLGKKAQELLFPMSRTNVLSNLGWLIRAPVCP